MKLVIHYILVVVVPVVGTGKVVVHQKDAIGPVIMAELEGLAAEEIQLLMVEQVLVEAAAARIDHMVTNHIDHTVDQLDTVVQE
nr:MAG TPA: hypothetical protein [Caudoviricetes sp.]